mmetsp:Transcript_13141/g.52445  ORF Transcript_13141/g.52445 Transcript_13141/m.52445 type:complete len:860 (+) Transcript_13141:44-2623(+)
MVQRGLLVSGICVCLLAALAYGQTLSTCEASQVSVSSVTLDSPVQQIIFASANKQDVYALTHEGHVWFSYNGGAVWEDKTSELEGWEDETLSFNGHSHGVVRMIPSSGTDHLVYFQGQGYVFWVTRDGEDYKQYTTGDYTSKGDVIVDLLPNPYDPNYVIASVRDRSCDTTQDTCFYRYDVSAQQGAEGTWTTMDTYIGVFYYGGGYIPDISWGGYEDQIFYTTVDESLKTGNQLQTRHIGDYRLVVATLFGSNTANVAPEGFCTFLYLDPVLYVGKYDEEDSRIDAYLSADYGETFVEMVFRDDEGNHIDGYTFFIMPPTDQEVSFITIQETTAHPYGDLYEASTVTAEYFRSLPNNRIDQGHGADFFIMPSLDGIFAANSYNVSAFETNGSVDLESYVKSTFTYNKGGIWHGVMPPDELFCPAEDPFCTLNLFMMADKATITPMMGDKNAVGLILAQGNEGYYRQAPEDSLYLYLSRNGGVSWDRILEGSYEFAMAAHGSLFVAAEKHNANNTLLYSWSQGAAFDGCIFSDENVFIDSIIYPQPPTSMQFLMLGADEERDAGVIYYVDFLYNIPRPCGSEDLEQFSPSIGGGCLLGARTEFTRRQRDVECFYNVIQEPEEVVSTCLCWRNDYVCDGDCFAEEHFGHATVCTNICEGTPDDPWQEPEDCEGEWLRTQGYRKVEGDICQGGMELDPVWVPCSDSPASVSPTPTPVPAKSPSVDGSALPSASPVPNASPSGSGTDDGDGDGEDDGNHWVAIVAGIILCLLIVIVAALIVLVCIFKTSPKMRAVMSKILPARLTGGSDEDEMYQVMGKGGESLLDDDFYNEPDASVMTPMSPTTEFSALPVVDDDEDNFDF